MIEPVYILDDGKKMPYVPIQIKDNRDAYAATLHVLFKHVADFHICIVKAFSKKYGIPEDDIMQTIQESEEFKNMHVDPALDPVLASDALGYLAQQPAPTVPTVPTVTTVPTVPAVPTVTTVTTAPTVTTVPAVPTVTTVTTAPTVTTVIKKRIVKKTITESIEATPNPAPTMPNPNEKKKVIRKKVNKEPVNKEPVNKEPVNMEPVNIEPVNSERNDVIASVPQVSPIAQLLANEPPTTQKKIIRRKNQKLN
jgi:hypothetical protein